MMSKDRPVNSGKRSDPVRSGEEADHASSPSEDSPEELLRLIDPALLATYFFGMLSLVTAVRIAVRLTPLHASGAVTALASLSEPFVYPLNHLLRVSPSALVELGSLVALFLYAAATAFLWILSQGWASPILAEEKAE